jgi:predicted SAM-dependent methyltransferase
MDSINKGGNLLKQKYLNIGCGNKTHPAWVNADFKPKNRDIINVDIRNELPFDDCSFQVVYHSQVLEHLSKEEGTLFIRECFRILKPGGVLRVVVPDLENIVREYLRLLEINRKENTPISQENYNWILLELFDQVARNKSTGEMGEYLSRKDLINQDYLISRFGMMAKSFFNQSGRGKSSKSLLGNFKSKIYKFYKSLFFSELKDIGQFRLNGEVHYNMYDSYSLGKLLADVGFLEIQLVNPHQSNIKSWNDFQLDVKDKLILDPSSLFMEGIKQQLS